MPLEDERTPASPSAAAAPRRRAERVAARMRRAAAGVETVFDRVRWSLRRRMGWIGPVEVVSYRGWIGDERVHLWGRVLERKDLGSPDSAPGRWRRTRYMLRRLRSDEIPDVPVRFRLGEFEAEGRTDAEGYFRLGVVRPALPVRPGWQVGHIEQSEPLVPGQVTVSAEAEVMVPSPNARVVIVSDIDDTILRTYVTRRLAMAWVTLTGDARTRRAFDATAPLFRALVRGPSGAEENPIFYVSQSPWNLYDFLTAFLERNELPKGPLLLRDLGLYAEGPVDSKATRICDLMADYPRLPFVLVGDSGERDPEVYLEVAAAHPGRVRMIYIRDLGGGTSGPAHARAVAEARRLGTDLLFVEHAREALEHARAHDLAYGG